MTGPIVPAFTFATEPFLSGGAVDELRITHCEDCDGWSFPPLPRCPHCRSARVAPQVASGRATVVAASVNHQPWHPAFPPPYALVIVALDEDDRAHLTTGVTGCAPEDVRIGMRVQVGFHQAEEVWLPHVTPIPGAAPGPLPEPRDLRPSLRPMVSTDKYEDKVVLSGIGMSRVGRRLMLDPLSLTVEACQQAVEDAGLDWDDIDGLATYPGIASSGLSEGGVMRVEEALGVHPTWLNSGAETMGQNGSIMTAMLAVAGGLCRHVLCFRTVWEATESALLRDGRLKASTDRPFGFLSYSYPHGAMSPANWIALTASHYLHRYGATREMLGHIAINARTNAGRNPDAVYRDPITMDDYLSARMISTPFGLYDCDTPSDGAVAVIVSARETAGDLRQPPVFVEACGTQVLERLSWDQDTISHMPQARGPAAHLWTRTDLRPADVDVAQLYDGFTFNTVSWLEGLGFCGLGEAQDFLDGGRTIALDGPLPLNTDGGQLSAGRLHGYGFVREAVLQLRGQALGRQVEGARVAVVAAGGGTPAGCMLLRTG